MSAPTSQLNDSQKQCLVYGWIRENIQFHIPLDMQYLIYTFTKPFDIFDHTLYGKVQFNKNKTIISTFTDNILAFGKMKLDTSIPNQHWMWQFIITSYTDSQKNLHKKFIQIGLESITIPNYGPIFSLSSEGNFIEQTSDYTIVRNHNYCPRWDTSEILSMYYDDGIMSFEINGISYGKVLNLQKEPSRHEMFRLFIYLPAHQVLFMSNFKY